MVIVDDSEDAADPASVLRQPGGDETYTAHTMARRCAA
jgi:hypothetical protein